MTERAAIELTGLVQGVGFRPFVYSLATTLSLRGFVQNRGAHVFVDVEGAASSIDAFVDRVLRGVMALERMLMARTGQRRS